MYHQLILLIVVPITIVLCWDLQISGVFSQTYQCKTQFLSFSQIFHALKITSYTVYFCEGILTFYCILGGRWCARIIWSEFTNLSTESSVQNYRDKASNTINGMLLCSMGHIWAHTPHFNKQAHLVSDRMIFEPV